MAVTPDNSTLICAGSYGQRLTAFDIATDGSLSNQRVWAALGDAAPDGICADAEGAVWYGDVPNKRCVRVAEGGEVLQTIELDVGCFACMLGRRCPHNPLHGRSRMAWCGNDGQRRARRPGAERSGIGSRRRLALTGPRSRPADLELGIRSKVPHAWMRADGHAPPLRHAPCTC
jgi:hypothetical protein